MIGLKNLDRDLTVFQLMKTALKETKELIHPDFKVLISQELWPVSELMNDELISNSLLHTGLLDHLLSHLNSRTHRSTHSIVDPCFHYFLDV